MSSSVSAHLFSKQESQALLQVLHHYESFSGCFYLDNKEDAAFDLSPLMTGSAQAYYLDQSDQKWDFADQACSGKFSSPEEEQDAVEMAVDYLRAFIEGNFEYSNAPPTPPEPWIDENCGVVLNLSNARDLLYPIAERYSD